MYIEATSANYFGVTDPIRRESAKANSEEAISFASAETEEYNETVDYEAYDEYDAISEEDYEADVYDVTDDDMATYAEIFDMSESY